MGASTSCQVAYAEQLRAGRCTITRALEVAAGAVCKVARDIVPEMGNQTRERPPYLLTYHDRCFGSGALPGACLMLLES